MTLPPHGSAPSPRFRPPKILVLLIFVGLVWFYNSSSSFNSGPKVTSGGTYADLIKPSNPCNQQTSTKYDQVLASWQKNRTIRRRDADKLIIDEYRWTDASRDAKVSMALSFFCRRFPGGTGLIIIKGYRDGKAKGSVYDGNFND